ncbi:hypothetical protein IHE45_07G059500 [Dioscorea alata]|uniref:Uncharacterized protein n=1 Tax=Dioscorea alata TaxID=55571 RepID=A0ACB7VRV8_DIOAL|nr:hypothetical protein IHE45_07G059500 [Dioscorea alata]
MVVPTTNLDLSKLEPLNGTNYRKWLQKLLIFFEQLEVDYVLFTDHHDDQSDTISIPATSVTTPPADQTKKADRNTRAKFEKDNKTIRGHLLNHMTDPLFDLFVNQRYTKPIWDTLEIKLDMVQIMQVERSMWLDSGCNSR